jgi:hypothetical protein
MSSNNITKCVGIDCPLRETCMRFNAPKNSEYTSYFSDTPYDHKNQRCIHFKPLGKSEEIKNEIK